MARDRHQPTELRPMIRRGRIEEMVIYEVSESELELPAEGSPNATYLNMAIGLLSVAISFIISLVTTTIGSNVTLTVFVVFAVCGSIVGFVLLLLWYRGSRSVAELVDTIKRRLPPERAPEPISPPP